MQDGVDGQAAGVKATPSFTINGKLVEGAQPFDVFKSEIDALLP
jgi:protein-disulfide isomerase